MPDHFRSWVPFEFLKSGGLICLNMHCGLLQDQGSVTGIARDASVGVFVHRTMGHRHRLKNVKATHQYGRCCRTPVVGSFGHADRNNILATLVSQVRIPAGAVHGQHP